jgi:hypothetical protein
MTSYGCCIHGCDGEFIMPLSGWFNLKLSIHESEVLSLGFNNVIFECDSDFGSIVSSIRRILASNHNIDVKFIRRQANMFALILCLKQPYASRQVYAFAPK